MEPQKPNGSSAVLIVWQWLTYSLWEASLLALSVLLSGTLSYYFVRKDSSYEFLLYAFGALVVLLPLAFFADKVYAKREPQQKTGFSAVVMVLNALLTFLVALSSTITGVVTLLSTLLNPGQSSAKTITVVSSAVIAVLGFLLFARILNPTRPRNLAKPFPYVILGIVGIAAVMLCAGPLPKEFAARSDKLVENNLPEISSSIGSYTTQTKQLPLNLGQLQLSSDGAKQLVADNLVEYTLNTKPPTPTTDPYTKTTNLYYRLCVTYKRAKNMQYQNSYTASGAGVGNYISTYSHQAGRQCYDQSATQYN